MSDTSARLLALLSLMQSRPDWPGAELAERLGVSRRTVRHDIDRLRGLGYPVEARRGSAGGYRLGAGAVLPPLLLDDQEAVAVAIGLRTGRGVEGIEESATRALAKIEQVLPHRLRRTVSALHTASASGPENVDTDAADPEIAPTLLADLAAAVRDQVEIRLRLDDDGEGPSRRVEPYRLVTWQRRWYLVGRAPDTDQWRTFRLDRLTLRPPFGRRFAPRPLPGGDYTAFVLRDVASTGWRVHARITVEASAEEVLARIHPGVGVVEAVDDRSSVLVTGADSIATVAVYIGMLGLDFRVTEPAALVDELRTVGERYLRATAGAGVHDDAGPVDQRHAGASGRRL